jgi:hypothetical protein
MIRGVHTMFYSSEPDAFRAFVRDKLRLTYTDVGEGWLIFDVPEADLGCHPAEAEGAASSGTPHVSFYCDDIEKSVAELQSRGVEFTGPVEDHGYGLVTFFRMPGGFSVQLYQPKYVKNAHPKPIAPAATRSKPAARKKSPAKKRSAPRPKSKPARKRPAAASKARTASRAAKRPRRRSR